MEEVYKDLNLSSLQDSHQNPNDLHQNPNFTFRDFLNRPLNERDPPVPLPPFNLSTTDILTPVPVTVLSLNSPGLGFEFLVPNLTDSHLQTNEYKNKHKNNTNLVHCLGTSSSSYSGFGSFTKRRCQEPDSSCSSGDARHKRMMKNRESAARSRARKQAYTNELELENAYLTKENAELKKQNGQLFSAAAIPQHPIKRTLQRTLTAPF